MDSTLEVVELKMISKFVVSFIAMIVIAPKFGTKR